MRKFILIAAMVLASATAQAGQSRSLTLAANDDQPAAATDQAKDAGRTRRRPSRRRRRPRRRNLSSAPRPSIPRRPAQPPKADAGKPVATAKADKLRRKNHWTEARIIGELHRHGIYW